MVALDRTERGEYVAAAEAFPGLVQVVELVAGAPVCLDPMRVLAGHDRAALTTGFLTLLTQTRATDLEGVAIAEAVEAAEARPAPAITGVLAELERLGAGDQAARTALRKVKAMSRSRLAGLVFDQDRELLATGADYVVFHMPGLVLPRREELLNTSFGTELLPEQVVS